MQPYKNLENGSSILQFKIGREYIIIQFKNKSTIEFTYERAGKDLVERLKQLAVKGRGLQRYILKQSHFEKGNMISETSQIRI